MTRRIVMRVMCCAMLVTGARTGAAVGDWTSYSRLIIRRVAATEDEVWAATEGGIIRSDLRTGRAQTYSPAEGLPDKTIYSVVIDERGRVWFGSENGGLIRFSRRPGLERPVLDPPLLTGQVFGVMALTAAGDRLYVGHRTGVTVLDLATDRVIETYHQLGPTADIRNEQVTALAVVGPRLIAGLESGLAWGDLNADLLLPGAWRYIRGAPFDSVSAIVEFGGEAYVATRSGVLHETVSGWKTTGPAASVHDLAVYDGALWAATGEGLFLTFDGETWQQAAGLTLPIRALAAVPDVMLVAATSEGTYRVERATSSEVSKVPGVDFPPSDAFRNLAVDTSGALWVAPGPASNPGESVVSVGIFRFKDNRWTQFPPGQNGLLVTPDRSGFVSIAVDRQNRIWAGSWGGGVALIDQSVDPPVIDRLSYYNGELTGLDDAPHFVVARTLLCDPTGTMWIGVWHSLLFAAPPGYVRGSSKVVHVGAPFLSRGEVSRTLAPVALAMDRAGVLWIGTRTSGVVLMDVAGTPTDSTDDQFVGVLGKEGVDPGIGMRSRNVTSIAVDQEGAVWVGTDEGLTAFRGTYDRLANVYTLTSAHYTVENGLPSNVVQAVIVDSANVKWVGTNRGLARITPAGRVINMSATRLVDPDGNVAALAFDVRRGYLWVGTPRGLNRYEAYPPEGAQEEITAQPSENPYRIRLSVRGEDYVLIGEPLTIIVTPGARLRIYTVTGELVWEATDSGIGQIQWDGRTRSGGSVVASGVYLYVAERGSQKKLGKIAVLRDAQ